MTFTPKLKFESMSKSPQAISNEYSPLILFSLEPCNRSLRRSVSHDISHFHYFLESEFGEENVRGGLTSQALECDFDVLAQLDDDAEHADERSAANFEMTSD